MPPVTSSCTERMLYTFRIKPRLMLLSPKLRPAAAWQTIFFNFRFLISSVLFQTCSSSGIVTQVSSALAIVNETTLCQLVFVSLSANKISQDAIVKWWRDKQGQRAAVDVSHSQAGQVSSTNLRARLSMPHTAEPFFLKSIILPVFMILLWDPRYITSTN